MHGKIRQTQGASQSMQIAPLAQGPGKPCTPAQHNWQSVAPTLERGAARLQQALRGHDHCWAWKSLWEQLPAAKHLAACKSESHFRPEHQFHNTHSTG